MSLGATVEAMRKLGSHRRQSGGSPVFRNRPKSKREPDRNRPAGDGVPRSFGRSCSGGHLNRYRYHVITLRTRLAKPALYEWPTIRPKPTPAPRKIRGLFRITAKRSRI